MMFLNEETKKYLKFYYEKIREKQHSKMDSDIERSYLSNLPVEILQHIFKYFNLQDLCRISQTCTRLHSIVDAELNRLFKMKKNFLPIVTNQMKHSIRERSSKIIEPIYEKLRISHNWRIGKYKEKVLLKTTITNMPWLHLEKKYLWVSQGCTITRYKRDSFGFDWLKKGPELIQKDGDMCRFAIKDDLLLTGSSSGSISMWNLKDPKYSSIHGKNNHSSEVNTVDIGPYTLASGTRNHILNMWPWPKLDGVNNSVIYPIGTYVLRDRIWSLKYNKSGSLAIGTGGIYETALLIMDVQSEELKLFGSGLMKPGAGILDMHWLDENCLFTCGYDSYVHLWDKRVGTYVTSWLEPHNSVLYCIQTDDLYTIMCGTQRHGKITLWDQRQRSSIQMYYLSTYHKQSSPVFSLAFDGTLLYGALDRSINVLDFSGRQNRIRNYSYFV